MATRKPVPQALLARQHGKGTMSEILEIERRLLREQGDRDMARQLAEQGKLVDLPTYQPANLEGEAGLSQRSRIVGDDLSKLGFVVAHPPMTPALTAVPDDARHYYEQGVVPTLPFPHQRRLLLTLRDHTLPWPALACQMPLAALAERSGIRNAKTIRKWLDDLHRRGHIEYVPVHGDPRGPVYRLTPPAEQARRWSAGEGKS